MTARINFDSILNIQHLPSRLIRQGAVGYFERDYTEAHAVEEGVDVWFKCPDASTVVPVNETSLLHCCTKIH